MKAISKLLLVAVIGFGLTACGETMEKTGDLVGDAAEAVGDVAEGAVDVAGDAAGAIGDAAGDAAGAVGDAAGDAVDAAGNAIEGAGDAMGDAVDGMTAPSFGVPAVDDFVAKYVGLADEVKDAAGNPAALAGLKDKAADMAGQVDGIAAMLPADKAGMFMEWAGKIKGMMPF